VPGFNHPYLDLRRMEMLRRVRLKPRGAAEGTFAGPHKSHYRGMAVEFVDYRDYAEGDDIRLVDWKVYARTDKHYVRQFEAERNLLSYVVLDTSGSMAYDGEVVRTDAKLVYACHLAAALAYLVVSEGDEVGLSLAAELAYLVVSEGDEVGLSLAAETVHEHLMPRGGWTHLGHVVGTLGDARPSGRTDLGACLTEVYRRIRRRGVLIVLSDFLDPSEDVWTKVDLFRKSKFDVMLFHVVHPEEVELPDVPMARFRETEGGGGRFDAEPDVLRDLYRERFARFVAGVEAAARTRGCDWHLARTDADPYAFLKHCFLSRQHQRAAGLRE
jgi:uncharacterized protein (DUF58 family)